MTDFPFEIHITVRGSLSIAAFKADCETLGVKPIVIMLQNQKGENVNRDVMTSSRFTGTTLEAMLEMQALAIQLRSYGYNVVREKLETVPWHPLAYNEGLRQLPFGRHFEAHFPVMIGNMWREGYLREIAVARNCHLSHNYFKQYADQRSVMMMTYRDYATNAKLFKEVVNSIRGYLTWANFDLDEEPEVEFCVYDSNVGHDEKWMTA